MLSIKNKAIGNAVLAGFFYVVVLSLASNAAVVASTGNQRSSALPTGPAAIIELQFRHAALPAVTTDLSRRSGVRFAISSSLMTAVVNAEVKASDWNDAIKSALAGFNYLATVDRNGRFLKIWLTGTEEPHVASVDGSENTVHTDVDLPGSVDSKALPNALWQPVDGKAFDSPWGESAHAEPIEIDPRLFDSLEVGQPVEIPIPQEDVTVFGVVGESHSQLNGEVQVWSGPVDGSHETASFTITRGEHGTYATVATGTSIYEVSVDNTTGAGTVVDEMELTKNVTKNDYIIPEHSQ